MKKLWKTDVVTRPDGKTAVWKLMPLTKAGFEARPGHWHKPIWVCIAVKQPRKGRM